jgi:RNA polymerase sigma-70 factor (ECF subfamily)
VLDWKEILSRDGPAAWKTALRVLGNRADADECFQEVCLAAMKLSRTESVKNWRALLQHLAAVRAIDLLRQRVRQRHRENPWPQTPPSATGVSPSQQAENTELASNLRSSLARLPSGQAEVFCLFHLSGWSYREIAESPGISVDLVGVWLQRARERLACLMAGEKDSISEVQQ